MIKAKQIIQVIETDSSPIQDVILYFFNQARQARRGKILNIGNSIHVKEAIEVSPDDLSDTNVNLMATSLVHAFLQKVNDKLPVTTKSLAIVCEVPLVNLTKVASERVLARTPTESA
jgi:hypothetical protein